MAFAIAKDTLPDWRICLSENNVPIESELVTDRGGTSVYFRDPDNHLIELATPGIWPTY
jgi:catechol 2,3-dioxygenase-like lactoylglutathione lyase family enzyme